MTNHRVGKTNTRHPKSWVSGKLYKAETNRYLRRLSKRLTRKV